MADVILLATALSKLIGMGMAGWKAAKEDGVGASELRCLKEITGSVSTFAKLFGSEPDAPAKHLELVLRSFGDAFKEHWGGNNALAPKVWKKRWYDFFHESEESERRKELAARVRTAVDKFSAQLSAEGERAGLELLGRLVSHPLKSPYYDALFDVFTDEELSGEDDEILLELGDGGRRKFEMDFLLAYRKGLAAPQGREILSYIQSLEEHWPELVRVLIAQELVGWKERHVFGNVREHDDMEHMPLEKMYVEPFVSVELGDADGEGSTFPRKAKECIYELLEKYPIVLVSADFGHGKSLTARTLAWEWAQRYLEDPANSLELFYPLFVKSGEDFLSRECDIKKGAKRALRRAAKGFGLERSIEDPGFDFPPDAQRTVIILDGLDEVLLSPGELGELFQQLKDFSSNQHRFLVLSRPAGLPHQTKREGIPVVKIQSFTLEAERQKTSQVEQWLDRWNTLRVTNSTHQIVTIDEIRTRDEDGELLKITQTPILLFMLAYTWQNHQSKGKTIVRKDIYEEFFRAIARGKYKLGKEEHSPIESASKRLLESLTKCGELEECEDSGNGDQVVQAMLWLMSRVAWEAHRQQQNKPDRPLTKSKVENILDGELEIPSEDVRCVQLGLLLVLQTDLDGNSDQILFGHKSFREFLVARFWQHQLRKLTKTRNRQKRAKIESALHGAELIVHEDRSFSFLKEFLNGDDWTEQERNELFEWAQETLNDEEPHTTISFGKDPRPVLRRDALAIGSSLYETSGQRIKLESEGGLRSMIAWFWLKSKPLVLIALDVDFQGANLSGANLSGANLSGANLQGVNLSRVNLSRVNLSGANLLGANLPGVNLPEVNLQGANLQGTNLQGTNLQGANLQGTNLPGAYLARANLSGAHLRGVNLSGAHLRGANLSGAHLQGTYLVRTRLQGADLEGADLEGANLEGANLSGANLSGVNLEGANLRRVKLEGANLRRAKLEGANLERARYNSKTKWPGKFKHKNVGMIGPKAVLVGAELVGADLEGVNLEGVNLEGVNLEGVNLEGVNLRRAKLEGANLEGARYDSKTKWPGKFKHKNVGMIGPKAVLVGAELVGVNLERADLEGADLKGVELCFSNLEGAKLEGASLKGANLVATRLHRADFEGADLEGANLEGANLRKANLHGTKLKGAKYNNDTKWPDNFDPIEFGAINTDKEA